MLKALYNLQRSKITTMALLIDNFFTCTECSADEIIGTSQKVIALFLLSVKETAYWG